MERHNPIIVAMDGMSYDAMILLARSLRGDGGCIVKVNDALVQHGVSLISDLQKCGTPVMADFKWKDIPQTMANSAQRLLAYPPWAVTVHASAGPEGVAAVVHALKGTPTKVLAITVLTSTDEELCREIYGRTPMHQVLLFAQIALRAGAHGLVCSPQEASMLRERFPFALIATPGVRSPGAAAQDQRRIGTPAGAIAAGANYVVMGRQVLEARDPRAEVQRVLDEELEPLLAVAAANN